MRWVGLVVLLGAAPTLAAAPSLLRVEVAGGTAPVVHLRFSAPPGRPVAHPLAADGATPDRVVLDFEGVALGRGAPRVVEGKGGTLLRVRTGQYTPTTLRVVLDLQSAMPSTVRLGGNGVTIALGDESPAPGPRPRPTTTSTTAPTTTSTASTRPPSSTTSTRPPTTTSTTAPTTSTSVSSTSTSVTTTSSTSVSTSTSSSTSLSTTTSSTTTTTSTSSSTTSTTPGPQTRAPARGAPRLMVIIDAGHGGRDPGASGIGGVLEKDITLAIARQLVEKLALRLPVTAILTRWDDSFVPLDERLPPEDGPPTIFLSLHANASTDPRPRGFEVFYGGDLMRQSGARHGSPRASRFAKTIAQALRSRLGAVRGHPRPGRFAVLTRNPAPGVLVELGYLTHAGDAARLRDPRHQDELTDALIDGITQYLRTDV